MSARPPARRLEVAIGLVLVVGGALVAFVTLRADANPIAYYLAYASIAVGALRVGRGVRSREP